MINLLPTQLREERLYGRRNRALLVFIASFAVAILLVVSVIAFSVVSLDDEKTQVQSNIDTNNVQITQLQAETSDVSALSARLETTYELFSTSIKFSELIPQIGELLPEGTTINGLTLTGGVTDPLALDVNLRNPDLAPVLLQNLTSSDLFEAADIETLSPSNSIPGYTFNSKISLSFTGSAEAKAAEAAAEARRTEAAAQAANEGDQQ